MSNILLPSHNKHLKLKWHHYTQLKKTFLMCVLPAYIYTYICMNTA